MVLLKAGACVPSSLFKLGFSCTCGSCKCGVTNDKNDSDEEQEGLNVPPSQLEMNSSLTPSASLGRQLRVVGKLHGSRSPSKADAILLKIEDDEDSTASGSTASTGSDSFPKDSVAAELPAKQNSGKTIVTEDCWYTPNVTPADCKSFNHIGNNPVEAAVAAALAPVANATPVLRHRHSESTVTVSPQRPPERESQQDWWDDADTKVVPSLETTPSLTRLLGADIVKHPGLKKKPAPWLPSESHSTYSRLGARDETSSYVAWWLNVGEASLLSVSEVLDRAAMERCLANDPLGKRVKLLIRAVKCTLPFPGKGPKEADTVGAFFGKGASLTRGNTAEGTDIIVLQIDLYYLYLLRFALQNVGFRQGNVVDIIAVDWPGQAVLASIRMSVTDEFLKLKG